MRTLRRQRFLADRLFDAIYPPWAQARSAKYWTPVEVACRAAELLVRDGATRVLDVGAGVGKFCLVGALTTVGVFTGLEQRGHLVEVARTVARRYGVHNARFVHGVFTEFDWQRFDALYFYNPFAENAYTQEHCLDRTVDLSLERQRRDLMLVFESLERAPLGARVVTYHGSGLDTFPRCFDREWGEEAGTDQLELWIRNR